MIAEQLNEIADALIRDMFRNGFGEQAERLVLTAADGRNLGGWSRNGARSRILSLLKWYGDHGLPKGKP